MPPQFSVITVVKNAKKTIGRTLESIQAQSFTDLEYIVIDGASNDGTLEILKNCERVNILISELDEGISQAFNKGIAASSGEWISFINADDWLEPDALENAAGYIAKIDSPAVICGDVTYRNESGEHIVTAPSQPQKIISRSSIHHPGAIIHGSYFERFGGFDERFHLAMDYELFFRLFRKGARFHTLPRIIANRTLGGVSYTNFNATYKEVYRIHAIHGTAFSRSVGLGFHYVKDFVGRILVKYGLKKPYRLFWEMIGRRD